MSLNLDVDDTRRLLSIDELFGGMRQALIDLSAKRVVQPLRSTMDVPGGVLFLKSALTQGTLATKLITLFPNNASKGLPTMLSTIVLMDPATGNALAIMDGAWITALRTAVVSAIGVDAMTPKRPLVVAILGSGVGARARRGVAQGPFDLHVAHLEPDGRECDGLRQGSGRARLRQRA